MQAHIYTQRERGESDREREQASDTRKSLQNFYGNRVWNGDEQRQVEEKKK